MFYGGARRARQQTRTGYIVPLTCSDSDIEVEDDVLDDMLDDDDDSLDPDSWMTCWMMMMTPWTLTSNSTSPMTSLPQAQVSSETNIFI